jgi:hypothetical protein
MFAKGAMGAIVVAVLILMALAVILGLALARHKVRWPPLAAAELAFALLSAVVLRSQGFGPLSGISVIVACLALNQVIYLVEIMRRSEDPPEDLPNKQADEVPRDGRKDEITHDHECNTEPYLPTR